MIQLRATFDYRSKLHHYSCTEFCSDYVYKLGTCSCLRVNQPCTLTECINQSRTRDSVQTSNLPSEYIYKPTTNTCLYVQTSNVHVSVSIKQPRTRDCMYKPKTRPSLFVLTIHVPVTLYKKPATHA